MAIDATTLQETFKRISAERKKTAESSNLPGFLGALHAVAEALRQAGMDVSLDMRPGRLGVKAPQQEKVHMAANGTLTVDGAPIELAIENERFETTLSGFLGGVRMFDYGMARDEKTQKWQPYLSTPKTLEEAILEGVLKVKADHAIVCQYALPPESAAPGVATEKTIAVSGPLRLRQGGQS